LPQSPELAGGAGFKFEDEVSGVYLASLLTRTSAPGTGDRVVTRVALQQREFGEPLDDLIVDSAGLDGGEARLSLQVKSSLTISAAISNSDFRDVVRDALATLRKTDFRNGADRFGVVTGNVAAQKARTLNQLIDFARNSVEAIHFFDRFTAKGHASQEAVTLLADLRTLVDTFSSGPVPDEEFHRFICHFTLIEFDFQASASSARADGVSRVAHALTDEAASQASLLWSRLCYMAGLAAKAAGVFDRPRLLREVKAVAPLRGLSGQRSDLQRLSELSKAWVSDIEKDVSGVTLPRTALRDALSEKLAAGRLVQISGLPGSGKSVLLRMEIEDALVRGPAFFLKHDRLSGTSWASFAAANGLTATPLADLMVEVGAVGASTVFIDGVDRVEREHRGIVLDVVRAVASVESLKDWRIVMTLRDTGIGPLRNWLGGALSALGVQTLDAPGLDDLEAATLASNVPSLEPVLTSKGSVREIARRPFFAKILQRASLAGGDASEFHSEVDLIRNWWLNGGYAADGTDALLRQRAIIDLGRVRARALSKPIAIAGLQSGTVAQVSDLVADGILQYVVQGISLRFAHDIFFEWAFFQTLVDRDDDWPGELVEAGQPPAFARTVELFSQSLFPSDDWMATLNRLSTLPIRSQWIRAWLLGPFGTPRFSEAADAYAGVVFAHDGALLYKALVWFQAERTTPNPNIISGDWTPEARIRIADALAWPSDIETWARLMWFLLERTETLPRRLRPQVTAVFSVWQHMFADTPNAVSKNLLRAVRDWLYAFDQKDEIPTVRRRRRGIGGSQRSTYVGLLLRAARVYPEYAETYLSELITGVDVDDTVFEHLVGFSVVLAEAHPALLADVTLRHLREELPADQHERELEENARGAKHRREALAIPEDQRTRDQQMAADGMFMSLGGPSFSYHDWDTLAIDRSLRSFSPASPLRQPYPALFAQAPDQAIRLVADLSNHATTAWRQLHTFDDSEQGTPLPLVLDFPWGRQSFWGTDREYLWSRGMWAPDALASGYLALDAWAFEQLAEGVAVDTLIQRIVEGNECVAVLGVAVALALHAEAISPAVSVMVQSQRLWAFDRTRFHKDLFESRASLMGFDGDHDRGHVEAIKRSLQRPVRRAELQELGKRYVLMGEAWAEPTRAAIQNFPNQLPFLYEEHRDDPEAVDAYRSHALRFAEVADLTTYALQATDQPGKVVVFHLPPSMDTDEAKAARETAERTMMETRLWTWAHESFEAGTMHEALTPAAASEMARDLDTPDLFDLREAPEELVSLRRGAVAAVAATVLKYRAEAGDEDLEWARAVTLRALQTPEQRGPFWTPNMIAPFHQTVYAARAIASDRRSNVGCQDLDEALISLIAHPLQTVALSAFEEALGLIEVAPPLAWAALTLAFDLCDIKPRRRRGGGDEPIHTPEDVRTAVTRAVEAYRAGAFGTSLQAPSSPWLPVAGPTRPESAPRGRQNDRDADGRRWTANPRVWDHHLATELIQRIPVPLVMRSSGRTAFLELVDQMLIWSMETIAPTWAADKRRERSDAYEWHPAFGRLLAKVAGDLDEAVVRDRILTPITSLKGENAYTLLTPFTDAFIRGHVFDSAEMPTHAMTVVAACLDRTLADPVFSRASYRAGELSGFDQPRLVEALMFVQVKRDAPLATRFANGDWSNVALLLPLVEKFVRAAGWSSTVMGHFLTLCERSKDHFPPDRFAELILSILPLDGGEELPGWHGTTLAARISGLVQAFSESAAPLRPDLALKLLRILDMLVDLGDRRSAALQQGETFREIQLTS
jgi:hypothetical protein